MEHNRETPAELIDLGQASTETLGPGSVLGDEAIGREPVGLSND